MNAEKLAEVIGIMLYEEFGFDRKWREDLPCSSDGITYHLIKFNDREPHFSQRAELTNYFKGGIIETVFIIRNDVINVAVLERTKFDLNNPTSLDDIIKWIAHYGEINTKKLEIDTEVFTRSDSLNFNNK